MMKAKENSGFQPKALLTTGTALLCLATVAGCAGTHKGVADSASATPPSGLIQANSVIPSTGTRVASPPVVIYKTRKDYSHNVPVLMDETRSRILSYPAPADLRRGDSLALPTPLEGGFWLDNRGINERVAFLSYTYEEYSRLLKAPSMDELMAHLLDRQPLSDLRVCGSRNDYDDIVSELNVLIRRNGW